MGKSKGDDRVLPVGVRRTKREVMCGRQETWSEVKSELELTREDKVPGSACHVKLLDTAGGLSWAAFQVDVLRV